MTGADDARWQRLFADLEAQYDAAVDAEREGEVRDRTRGELARLQLVDRLHGAKGHDIAAQVQGVGVVRGRLLGAGADWLLLAVDAATEAVVATSAVLGVAGLGRSSASPDSPPGVDARLGLGSALRALARSRAQVAVTTVDGSVVHGTLDRVGRDFVEVAEHPPGEPRRGAAVSGVRLIPMHALAVVRAR